MAGRKEYELLFKLKAALGSNFNSSFQTAMNSTKQLQNTMSKINSTSGKIDSFKRQSEAVAKNKEKLTELNAEHERLQREMAQTEQPSEALKKQFERNQNQIERTTNSIADQERRLGQLGGELRDAGVNTERLEESNQKLARSYAAIQKNQEALAKITASQQRNKEAIANTKRELAGTVGVITAIGAAIYAGPVKKAQEFEAQMSAVKAISGANAKEMILLAEKAKEMGATTKFTAVESGQALEYMAMAGWKTNAMVDGLPGVMNLAAASGEELALVSDIVTDALTAFGLQASDSAHFADVLAKASASSNTNVSMLGGSFSYVAPIAGAMKYSIEDIGVALGLMANQGIKAEKAGTALRGMLTRLAKPPKQARDALDDLGISIANADGTVKPFQQTMKDLRAKFAGLTEEQKIQYAASIAGQEAMSGMLAIVNSSDADFEKLTKDINNANGAAAEMAAIKLANYDGQMKLLMSAFEGLQLAVGEALLPSLTEGIKKITQVVTKITEFANANPELTKTILKVAAGLGAFKLATLTAKLGFLELKGGALAVQKVFTLFRGRAAVAGVEAMGLSGRLRNAGAGLKNYFGNIKNAFGGVSAAIKNTFIGGKLSNMFAGFGNVFKGIGGKILGVLTWIGAKIAKIFGGVGAKIAAGPLGKIAMLIAKPFIGIGKLMGPLFHLGAAILAPFSGIFAAIFPVFAVVTLIIAAIQILGKNMGKVRDIVGKTFGEAGLAIFDKLVGVITKIGDTIKSVFSESGLNAIKAFIDKTFGKNPLLANFLKSIVDVFGTIGNIVGQFIGFVETSVVPVLERIIKFVVETLLPIIAQKLTEWLPVIANILQGLWTIIQGVLSVVMEGISFILPIIENIVTGVLHTIGEVIGGLLTAISGIIDFVTGVFTGNWEQAWNGVKDIFVGIFQSLGGLLKAPLNAVISIVNGVVEAINKVGFDVPDWVPGIGGKEFRINVPKIPMFAKGTNFTPDTFIAGEKGAELITGAKGRKVFTAAQTGQIFNNINRYNETSIKLRPETTERVTAPRLKMVVNDSLSVTVYNQPTIEVTGDRPADLDAKLEANNRKLVALIEGKIASKKRDEKRLNYE